MIRFWGHSLNQMFPGGVADAGTYALIGAAAINGGVTRVTVSMTIIMLETSGNITYLLPLMITFIASRYAGNAINLGIYDIQLYLKDLPFVGSNLASLGLIRFIQVSEVMSKPLVFIRKHEKVGVVFDILKQTVHNGYPVINSDGTYSGLIMRKTLCSLLELKAFSRLAENDGYASTAKTGSGARTLDPPARFVFYDALESAYPKYTDINSISLTDEEKVSIIKIDVLLISIFVNIFIFHF